MRLVMLAIFAALNLFVAPVTAEAQAQKIFRVGYLGGGSPSLDQSISIGFVRGLRDQGYVEGQNLAIDYRWTRGTNEGFPALAAELVTLKVDVSKEFGPSSSGKTIIIASTKGSVSVPDREEKIELNVYRKK